LARFNNEYFCHIFYFSLKLNKILYSLPPSKVAVGFAYNETM
jgi:hypothetical protein